MRCPFCFYPESRVVDSRETEEGASVRRRRQCLSCEARFTTYERTEATAIFVVKKGAKRERFDRNKILAGILKACKKRPVRIDAIETGLKKLERELQAQRCSEVASEAIGRKVLELLQELDPVAYIRFASVYRNVDSLENMHMLLEDMPSS